MENRYKQLEQDVSALSAVVSQLGVRLSDAAKDATASGMLPSEKLIEQIQAARSTFDNVRSAVHGQATSMLVSPLPKLGELMSITSLSSLLKAASAAEESRSSHEGERERALSILSRALAISHRETADFKPLQECHAKIGELKTAIANVAWPNRHPELESIVKLRHASSSLVDFVENLDTLEDEKWMALESTITGAYGKPLFVAASRGKLAATPEKKNLVEKPAAPPAPAVNVEKKVATPPAPVVAMVEKPVIEKPVIEKKEVTPEPVAPKPVFPAPPAVAPTPVSPVAAVEKKEHVAPAPTPTVIAPAQPLAAPHVTPPPSVAPVPTVPPAAAAQQTPAASDAPVPPRPPAPVPVTAQAPTPTPSHSEPSTTTASVPGSSLSALATATDPAKLAGTAPSEADKLRKEPRLATPPAQPPAPAPAPKVESKPQDQEPSNDELQKAMAGDSAQRPQRWGFWRGNR